MVGQEQNEEALIEEIVKVVNMWFNGLVITCCIQSHVVCVVYSLIDEAAMEKVSSCYTCRHICVTLLIAHYLLVTPDQTLY